jgi:multiple sugar transport system permease protein
MSEMEESLIRRLAISDRVEYVLRYLVIAFSLIVITFPIYWMVAGAIQDTSSLFSGRPNLVPVGLTLASFTDLLSSTNTITYLKNSIIVTTFAVLFSTAVSTMAGYGLARFKFRGRVSIARSILFTYMFSPIVLGIPLYILFYRFGMLNTYFSVILAQSAIATPFGIWLMWQYFQTIPVSVEEAAWMQGASYTRTLWDVVLPMARPGYVATAIFSFAVSWSDFTMAKLVLTNPKSYTIMVGAQQFLERNDIGWGQTMATGVIISIPSFLILLFLQDYLLQGFDIE